MRNLADSLHQLQISKGKVAVFWLGQAGFLFRTADGILVAVDPYFSDCCERYSGFKRLMPKLMNADDVKVDLLITTHAHYDHFDVDSIPVMLANGDTHLIAAEDGRAECQRLVLPPAQISYLKCGDEWQDRGACIKAMPCDHGELAPDALGILLVISGKRIYITGDTCYRPDLFENPELKDVDLLILPINGAFGNLNEAEAAQTVKQICPKLAIPCHFWNFAEHGGNPGLFAEQMKENASEIPFELMPMGGHILI